MKKLILIIGPESSGSTLIAKVCAKSIMQESDGFFNSGDSFCTNENQMVIHKSLPEHLPPIFCDINSMIVNYENKGFEVYVILTTRDITISEHSRIKNFLKTKKQVKAESAKAKEIMIEILSNHSKTFIWSYETFMYLGEHYLNKLSAFLDIELENAFELRDGNHLTIKNGSFVTPPEYILKLKRRFRNYKHRYKFYFNKT